MFNFQAGDLKEAKAIEKIFCGNRTETLKIGAVKSNMGHAEAASGMCSLAKVILAYERGIIPPNINFENPRLDIEALHNGKLQVLYQTGKFPLRKFCSNYKISRKFCYNYKIF